MVKYSGACKRNKDYSVNCDGDCASCKVVNAETGKFDIYGFMEQATLCLQAQKRISLLWMI